jgi:hypothetical protein
MAEEMRRGCEILLKCHELEKLYETYVSLPIAYIGSKRFKIMTKEFKKLLEEVRRKLKLHVRPIEGFPTYSVCEGDGFTIEDHGDEIIVILGGKRYDLEQFPDDVAKLIWTIWRLFMNPPENMVDEGDVLE